MEKPGCVCVCTINPSNVFVHGAIIPSAVGFMVHFLDNTLPKIPHGPSLPALSLQIPFFVLP